MHKKSVLMAGIVSLGVLGAAYVALPDRTEADVCKKEEPELRMRCYVQTAHDIAQLSGTEAAIAYARDVVEPYSRGAMHAAMHEVGMHAYTEFGGRAEALAIMPPDALSEQKYFFYEGYLHGVLMAFFKDRIGDTPAEDLIQESCADSWLPENDSSDPNFRAHRQCFHGIGHGLMAGYRNNIASSSAACARLPYAWMQDRCAFGVYMEASYLFSVHNYPMYDSVEKPDTSLAEVCSRDAVFSYQCAMFVGRSYLEQHRMQFAGAFNQCAQLSGAAAQVCRQQIAEVSVTSAGTDVDEIHRRCAQAGTYENECLVEVGRALRNGYGGEAARSLDFCSTLEDELVEPCRSARPL